MVSTLEEKFSKVRRKLCFYLDIEDQELSRSLSRRLQDMGLQQECVLSSRVTHAVVSGQGGGSRRPKSRADAMLRRCAATPPPPTYLTLTVQQAISLLDKLYDTFFAAPRKPHVKHSTKEFIKIEFLDKNWRPVFKEFDEWPDFSLEPDPPREKREIKDTPENQQPNDINQNLTRNTPGQKMTRKSRPRIKEKEEKEAKGGYCEMCNVQYTELSSHRRSASHAAFVRDDNNFLALDALIAAGADVATFLGKQPRRNGDLAASPEPLLERPTRRRATNHHYYKVVGVSTKLRSSGGFATKKELPAAKKESPPTCNGAKPLVVKFRKVRRSELSVLSDEAEQFMFPKRPSSASSSSSDDEKQPLCRRRPSPPPAATPPAAPLERRRLARPLALKEESSEEDSWPDDKRRRRRRVVAVPRRARRAPPRAAVDPTPRSPPPAASDSPPPAPPAAPAPPASPPPASPPATSPPATSPAHRCLTWDEGRLKYTPAVEQLEFAFESVPRSEPWYDTFTRQDRDGVSVRNVPGYFALYQPASDPPKLPYEIGQLPPLKPNCCPLSELVTKREEKAGPSRSYGTRGKKLQKIRSRAAALQALEARPRKSPREHASTLAMLRSAALLRRKPDDASAASDDAASDAAPPPSAAQQHAARLQRFLAAVFEEACELDDADAAPDAPALAAAPDLPALLAAAADPLADLLRAAATAPRRRRANRTGWPSRKRPKKDSRASSLDACSSAEPDEAAPDPPTDVLDPPDESPEPLLEPEEPVVEPKPKAEPMEVKIEPNGETAMSSSSADTGPSPPPTTTVAMGAAGAEGARRRRRGTGAAWLQPVVRVARVDARRLRSAARRPPR